VLDLLLTCSQMFSMLVSKVESNFTFKYVLPVIEKRVIIRKIEEKVRQRSRVKQRVGVRKKRKG
jgi:hypothetical protein